MERMKWMEGISQEGRSIKMWWKIVSVGLVSVAWLLSAGSQALGLDIATALALAERNDARFRAEVMEARARDADGWSLVAGLGPRVAVTGEVMRSRLNYHPDETAESEDRQLEDQRLKFYDDKATLSLDQPLLDMEKIN